MRGITRLFFPALYVLAALTGWGAGPEAFHVELTGSACMVDTRGSIQSGGTPVDLRGDLGVVQPATQFDGLLVVKPARRHRLIIEGIPYRLDGDHTISRSFTFHGSTYNVQDRVVSHAEVNYVFGGYQYDFLSRPAGHLGIQGGIAYVDATGTLTSTGFGFSATESRSAPFPLAGLEGRTFLLHGWLVVGGLIKGMDLGSYGHYVQGAVHGGIGLGRHVSLLAGYQVVEADLHGRGNTSRIAPRFSGPLVAVQFRE